MTTVLLSVCAGCSQQEVSTAPVKAEAPPLQARVVEVAEQEWPQVVATQGNLVADETARIGIKVAGRVERVYVDLGDIVTAGMVLAVVDRREYEERVHQAEAAYTQARAAIGLDADDDVDKVDPNNSPVVVEQKAIWEQAQADRERVTMLRSRQVATDATYQAAVAAEQVAAAKHAAALNAVREKIALVRVRAAELEVARQNLADTEIRTLFDGRVQERHVSVGTYVQAGDQVVTIIRDNPLRYRGTVPEPYASTLAIGQKVRLQISSGRELPEVTITRISPSLDPFSRSLLFEALVPNADHAIPAGQFTQGEVVLSDSRRVIALPKSAVVEFAGTRKVWKVVEGNAVEQSVETGLRREDLVEIVTGLAAGDQVLVDGAEGRSAKVEIQEVVASKAADATMNLRGASASR